MNPCKDCENKGCGAFHDKCEPYRKFKEGLEKGRDARKKCNPTRDYIKETTFRCRTSHPFTSCKK